MIIKILVVLLLIVIGLTICIFIIQRYNNLSVKRNKKPSKIVVFAILIISLIVLSGIITSMLSNMTFHDDPNPTTQEYTYNNDKTDPSSTMHSEIQGENSKLVWFTDGGFNFFDVLETDFYNTYPLYYRPIENRYVANSNVVIYETSKGDRFIVVIKNIESEDDKVVIRDSNNSEFVAIYSDKLGVNRYILIAFIGTNEQNPDYKIVIDDVVVDLTLI